MLELLFTQLHGQGDLKKLSQAGETVPKAFEV